MFINVEYISMKFVLLVFMVVSSSIDAQFDPSLALAYGSDNEDARDVVQSEPTITAKAGNNLPSATSTNQEDNPGPVDFLNKLHSLRDKRKSLSDSDYMIGKDTLLHHAIKHGYADETKQLITYASALGCSLDAVNADNETALHLAVRAQHLDLIIIRMLLKAGANRNSTNSRGEIPLDILIAQHASSESNYSEVYALLDQKKLRKRVVELEHSILNELNAIRECVDTHTGSLNVLLKRETAALQERRTINADLDAVVERIEDLYQRQNRLKKGNAELFSNLIERDQSFQKLKLFITGASLVLAIRYIYAHKKIRKKLYSTCRMIKERYLYWITTALGPNQEDIILSEDSSNIENNI